MAGGYLGKISAVISANTGGYVRSLRESANETRSFAKTVESTIRRASSDAAKSLQSIYTPLQQFERALRAAASEKLSFKGFDGAIRTVEQLKQRLATIRDSDVDIVVKASGMKTLTDLRTAINDISSRDIELFGKAGGMAGLQKIRADLVALSQLKDVTVKPKVSLAQIDALIAKFSRIEDTQINVVMNVLGERELDASLTKARRLQELSSQIATPLAGASQQFDKLAGSVQAAFIPALNRAQQAVEAMKAQLEAGGDVGVREFLRLEKQVTKTAQAISRLSEASAIVSRLGNGTDLRSVAPRQADALNRAAAQQAAANALPAQVAAGFGLNRQQVKVTGQASQLRDMLAKREQSAILGEDTSQIDASIARRTAALEKELDVQQRLTESANQYMKAQKRVDTGTFQPRADLEKSAADLRKDVFRRLENSGNFVSSADLVKSAKGFDRGTFQPIADLEKAGGQLARIQQQIRDVKAESNFKLFDEAFETSQIDAAKAKLKVLQDILIKNGISSGEAAEEVNNLAEALRKVASTRGGFLDKRAQQGLQTQEDAAVAAVAAAAPRAGSVSAIRARLARAGDIGRAGLDKFSLAAQQAGFAIDDFLSSTGGIDQKLRAVSNNITQLAFILGGTKGLFIGLGAVIGGQVFAQISKFINAGTTAEDRTKSLNDSLAKQKSLVESLAQAFGSLGDSISQKAFSAPAQKAREFSDSLAEIVKKQEEYRKSLLADIDPAVQRERAQQTRLARERDASESPGQRAALEAARQASIARERTAANAAAARSVTPDAARLAVLGTIRYTDFDFREGGRVNNRSFRLAREAQARAAEQFDAAGGDIFAVRRAVQQRLDQIRPTAERQITVGSVFGGDAPEILRAQEDFAQLEQVLRSLEASANKAADSLAINFLKSANAAANELETAQSRAAQAIESAVPGAVALQAVLDGLARQVDEAQKRIKKSIEDETLSPEDRKAIVEKAEKEIADARVKREEATAKATELAFQRIVDPRGLLENVIGRSQQSLQDSGFGDGRAARDLRVIDASRQILQERISRQIADGVGASPEDTRRLEALNGQATALEATTLALRSFGEALNSISQTATQDVGSLQQRAEQARRDDIRLGTPETANRRERSEQDLLAAKEVQRQVENSVQTARERAEQQIVGGGTALGERLRQIEEQLAVPAGQVSSTGVRGGTIDERAQLRREAAGLEARRDAAAADSVGAGSPARLLGDELTRRAEEAAAADRGRVLGMSPVEKAKEEIRSSVNDLRAEAARVDDDVRNRFVNQGAQNLMEQFAPAIMGFREERLNAILQGPSRAALNAADINTSEGSRELNRLLRGEDPAKEVNLEELRKQSGLLKEIVDAIRADTGEVVDIRG